MLNAGSVVKSVQRGFAKATGVGTTVSKTIQIDAVDINKCIVILNASNTTGGSDINAFISLKELNETSLVVEISNTNAGTQYVNYSWQVIEFY